MQIDKTTLTDLSIFHSDEYQSVFHHLNHTQTNGGREYLRYLLGNPLNTVKAIQQTQETIQHLSEVMNEWPVSPSNGTIMVMEKFYESQIANYPLNPGLLDSLWYKFFYGSDFSLTNFTIKHAIDFFQGMEKIRILIGGIAKANQLFLIAQRIEILLNKVSIKRMLLQDKTTLSATDILVYASFIRLQFKSQLFELIDIYSKLDAYMSMAKAGEKYEFCYPEIIEQQQPYLESKGLFHFLLETPISYDISLTEKDNFLFLTGANMAGKSTFIKAAGLGVYLAHIGMGVPAKMMRLSVFDGLLSNIQVQDNMMKGESFFFNEVQRIKNTIERISDGKKWLILIDELFKGTNQQDAVKCSTTVIEGLRKLPNALFILSTHLYEIGDNLRQYKNIQFMYFETAVENDQLVFSYQLKEGISNDRIGYLILKREGVINLLEKL
ncbi:MAG: DNA mismatch repair protein MutS [Sphingobacteriia bacterium]|nr:MAG: DNA mismatch repair protein MutS [Sphingobacteriia bacterium]TAH08674.1 MAG: DNA mismatch repair protein MutS [Sphingobacteriia bacterium]